MNLLAASPAVSALTTTLPSGPRWAIAALVAIGLTAALAFATLVPALLVRWRQRVALRRRTRGRLVLTYDDGPEPRLTPALLDLLADRGARATFFIVGFRALRHPELCDRIARAGHELGCHAFLHRNAWRQPPWRPVLDLVEGYRRMERWLAPHAPFRPPFGKLTTWSWLAARRRGVPLAWWTCDAGDQRPDRPDAAAVADRITRDGGGVVLLHFHDSGPDREAYVLDATRSLLDAAERAGLEVCTYDELPEKAA